VIGRGRGLHPVAASAAFVLQHDHRAAPMPPDTSPFLELAGVSKL